MQVNKERSNDCYLRIEDEKIQKIMVKKKKLKKCKQLLEVIKKEEGEVSFRNGESYIHFSIEADYLRLNLWGDIKEVVLELLESYYSKEMKVYEKQVKELLLEHEKIAL